MRSVLRLSIALVAFCAIAGAGEKPSTGADKPRVQYPYTIGGIHFVSGNSSDLLKTDVKAHAPTVDGHMVVVGGYRMAYESTLKHVRERRLRVRVWRTLGGSWPGPPQRQIIQVLNADGVVLAATRVGGQPMTRMTNAWSATHHTHGTQRLFVYIKCDQRRRTASATYVYEVKPDLSIVDRGIYYDKEEIAEEDRRRAEMIREALERFRSRRSPQPPDGSDAAKPGEEEGSETE